MAIDNPQEPEVTVTTPHAGNIDDPSVIERPKEEFPNTSLQEAIDQGHIDPGAPPDDVATIPEHDEIVAAAHASAEPEKKSRKGLIAAGVAGAALAVGGLVVALGGGGSSNPSHKDGATKTPSKEPAASSNKTNGETSNVIAPESLSPDPIPVQTGDKAEAIKQIYANYFNGVNAGSVNSVYDKYVQYYVENEGGEMANNLRSNAQAIATEIGSFGKGANEKLISVEVDPGSVVVDSEGTTRATATRVYSVTNTEDSTTYPAGVDVTHTYKQVETVVVVNKTVNGKPVQVFSDETKTLSQDLVSTTQAEHKPY